MPDDITTDPEPRIKPAWARARDRNWRLVIVITGEAGPARALARQLLHVLPPASPSTWLIAANADDWPDANAEWPWIDPEQATRHLGRTLEGLVFDSLTRLAPEAFAALSGTLRGGGWLIWLLPGPASRDGHRDPDTARLFAWPRGPEHSRQGFLRYLLDCVRQEPAFVTIDATPLPITPEPSDTGTTLPRLAVPIARSGHPRQHEPSSEPALSPTPEQQRIIAAIEGLLRQDAPGALLVQADRGRGKSTALALALARQDPADLRLTATRRAHVQTLLAQFPALRGQWRPPDRLLHQPEPCRLLIIDEAASLPLPLLRDLLRRYPRVVLATTLSGYEGSAQGYRLKLDALLDQARPGWSRLCLDRPMRWAPHDPLEQFVDRTLLGRAVPLPPTGPEAVGESPIRIGPACDLLGSPSATQAVFTLLTAAHYRTTPDDLRVLLDSPDLVVAVTGDPASPQAAAWLAWEHPIEDPAMCESIRDGTRRPRGRLSQLTLAQQAGIPMACDHRILRVVRIAVQPGLERQGLGRHLLGRVIPWAASEGADLVCASFALSPAVARFWWSQGFALLRIGLQRDHVTASHSLLVGRALTAAGETLQEQAVVRWRERLRFDLFTHLRDLEIDALDSLLPALRGHLPLSAEARTRLECFAAGHCNVDSVDDLLQQLALTALGLAPWPESRRRFWLECVVLHRRGLQADAWAGDQPGRQQQLQQLRHETTDLLRQMCFN